ncbi:MAG: response regulator [Nitrospinae bacterium]|nr:response regulator [Nitrospinota bacterium]
MTKAKNQRIGEFIAEKLNISSEKFNELLEIQSRLDDKLGDIAVLEGLISGEEKEQILDFQKKHNVHFGNAGIFLGLLKYSQLKYLLDIQAKKKHRIGELLVKKKMIEEGELLELLSQFYSKQKTPFSIVAFLSDSLLQQIREIAKTYNYDFHSCDKEEDLPALVELHSPQLIFLDDQKGNGLKNAQRLFKQLGSKSTKIAFFSSSEKKLMALTGYTVGIDYFLPLPFNIRHLINIIIDADIQNKKSLKKSILVVDDSHTIRISLQRELEEEGYQVILSENGEEGVKIATLEKPDLITMDIDMPVMNGYDACRKLKENPLTATIPIIMITARNSVEERSKGFEVGVVEYFTKPFTKGHLATYIQHILSDNKELRKDKVIAADDSKFSQSIFKSVLNQYGFESKIVENGQGVLDLLNEGYKPSCILLDYRMPVMDGLETCKRIKENKLYRQIPVIIVTSSLNKNLVIQAIKTGAEDYLAKPFDSDELIARIESHIKNYTLINQLNKEIQARKVIERKLIDRNNELKSLYKKINHQLKETGELQQKLLPEKILTSERFKIDVVYQPCYQSGGDYYDFFKIGNDYSCFLIADVSGHGASATIIMTNVRNYIHLLLNEATSPGMALRVLNGVLCEHSVNTHYLTMFYSIYDHKKNTLTYASAGHFPPMFYKKKENTVSYLNSYDGTPLVLFDDDDFPELTVDIEEGDMVLLYTDGYHESTNSKGEYLSLSRMQDVFHKSIDKKNILDSMMSFNKTFLDEGNSGDDIALMLVKFL